VGTELQLPRGLSEAVFIWEVAESERRRSRGINDVLHLVRHDGITIVLDLLDALDASQEITLPLWVENSALRWWNGEVASVHTEAFGQSTAWDLSDAGELLCVLFAFIPYIGSACTCLRF
jgi:hypothetical protein